MTQTTAPSSQMPSAPTVLIVGAGPTGLMLACELARRGVSFRLIEAAPGPQPGSRGKGIQPRTLEMFDDLGIVDRVLAHGRMAMPMQSTAPDGRVTRGGAVPESLINRPDIPYPASVITPEWRTEEALRLRLADFGGAVEFGTTLTGFEQSDECVSATLVKDGAAETVTAQWLVGCDGGHSTVRIHAGIGFEGETREEVRMIVADVQVDGLDRDAWHLWPHTEGLVSLCPLPSTQAFQCQATIAPGQDPTLSLANMQAILQRRTGRTDIRLHDPSWTSLWRANVRLADRYRDHHVFLAGDAAHIHSPAGGQGMNTGIQDSANLGWKLAAVANGASPALLDTYEAERRPVAAHVLALSDARLKQVIDHHDMPTRRDASTIQLDVGYRGSALASDDRDDTAMLRAGDRAPDATRLTTTDGERRLFDLTRGGRFTLLSFGDTPAVDAPTSDLKTLHVVGHPADPDDITDTEGHLADAYGPTDHTLVLIRPDGYIALISDAGDTTTVSHYLATICQAHWSALGVDGGARCRRCTRGATGLPPPPRTPDRPPPASPTAGGGRGLTPSPSEAGSGQRPAPGGSRPARAGALNTAPDTPAPG
jgi:2-polyprenyl-6-methoxyphenol hydroxylase-like FAD-dependent oxidoreductase